MSGNGTISVAMITKNEAANLRQLLPTLSWATEVVVVDSGSTDDTVDVARSQGCRLVEHPFDTFACQRNRALALSSGEWVLSLDGDERPTERLVDAMQAATRETRHAAYRVPIRSEILGRPVRRGGTQDDRPVRFFRRVSAHWTGDVHEVLQVTGRVGELAGWIDHRTLPTRAVFLEKIQRYTALEAAARVRAGRRPKPLDFLVAPAREVLRRLIYKLGLLDGPAGWQFAFLSGYSEWVLARRHRQLWSTEASRLPSEPGSRLENRHQNGKGFETRDARPGGRKDTCPQRTGIGSPCQSTSHQDLQPTVSSLQPWLGISTSHGLSRIQPPPVRDL